jgi:hypothetical protein
VDEEVPNRLEVIAAPFQEIDVLLWNQTPHVGSGNIWSAFPPVKRKGRHPPNLSQNWISDFPPSRAASSIFLWLLHGLDGLDQRGKGLRAAVE